MKLKDTLAPLEGHLSVFKVYGDGAVECCFSEDNLIVLAAKVFLLSGIYTAAVVSDPIILLEVGTGGTVDPGGLYPKPENPAWVALNAYLASVTTSFVTDLTIPSVTFLADIDQATANGSLITEAGLFKASGAMFNIKTFPGIPKTSEFSLHFSWTIKIA